MMRGSSSAPAAAPASPAWMGFIMKQNKLSYKIGQYLMFGGPATILFFAVVILPFFYGLYLTFTSWDGVSAKKPFVGLDNYKTAIADTAYWQSLGRTFVYSVIAVVLVNIVAFLLAYMVTSGIKGQNFFRAGFFIPNLIGGIVLGYIWLMIFDGILSNFDTAVVLETKYGFWGLIILMCWQQIGYMMIIYIAGLQAIPEDMLEAAKIDGASSWKTLWNITIPNIMPSITICTFLSLTNGFKLYDQNLALTGGSPFKTLADGNVIKTTEMLALNIVNSNTSNSKGPGQAKAVVFFILVAIISIAQLVSTRKKEVDQ